MPTLPPRPEHPHPHYHQNMAASFVAQPAGHHHPPGPMLHHIVTTGMVGSGTPTPTSVTPVYNESPGQMDFYSPASTSYLPTPPLVPSHSHPALLPRHPAAGASNVHRSSLVPSPGDDHDSRRASDAFIQHRGSDGRKSSDVFGLNDASRRGSEPVMANTFDDGRIGVEDPCESCFPLRTLTPRRH